MEKQSEWLKSVEKECRLRELGNSSIWGFDGFIPQRLVPNLPFKLESNYSQRLGRFKNKETRGEKEIFNPILGKIYWIIWAKNSIASFGKHISSYGEGQNLGKKKGLLNFLPLGIFWDWPLGPGGFPI